MNEEIDEYDIYHQDFTTASDWEVFIARLEEILNDWRLSKSKNPQRVVNYTNKWISKNEEIYFYGLKFHLSYHSLLPENKTNSAGVDISDDKDSKSLASYVLAGLWEASKSFISTEDGGPYPLSTWYGLKRYVMLLPGDPCTEESRIKLLMSSINIAFSNVECTVPVFLKIREHWEPCFLGVYENNDYRTNFDTIYLKRIPSQCYHLSGLSNLFKAKIASPLPLDPIQMSAKFSYSLKDLEAFVWKKPQPDSGALVNFDLKNYINLPVGAIENPLEAIMLNVMWPRFYENAVMDSATYSDFDPLMAPVWTITYKKLDTVKCVLSETINQMLEQLDNDDFLMDAIGLSRSLGLINPLDKIAGSPVAISKLVTAALGASTQPDFKGPIPDECLMPLLYYIFPDAVEDDIYNYPQTLEVELKQGESNEPKLCGYIKTSPEGGLSSRLSVIATRLFCIGGLPYLAHFWYEVVQELKYRWKHSIMIPGVMSGQPNARTCLLHQKLQLLNCCIERLANSSKNETHSSEEEFYDCSEGEEHQPTAPWNRPVGRLCRLGNAVMRSGAPLYIPRTQDPPPKTEEQLEEDAEMMLRLGEGARASGQRARMMSASLLSDMESFKAANPGAELCDFVQWYSPRDWLPDGGGALGERMLLPDNPWVEAWAVARPVPAARQRRLFDENRVAKRVIYYLRSRTVGDTFRLLLPEVFRAGSVTIMSEYQIPPNGTNAGGFEERRVFELAAYDLYEAERELARERRRRSILVDAYPDTPLDADDRNRVLSAAGGTLPAVCRREFTLRAKDKEALHVLRAILAQDMFLIGAFSEHTVLY